MTEQSIQHPVSVIIPALNEADSIGPLIETLLSGSRVPDEIVIADGGSTDLTRNIAAGYPSVRVVDGPGGISENRNAAIAAALGPIIACTDAGCLPDAEWLARITKPFESGATWVGGLSRPAKTTRAQAVAGLAMMPAPSEIDPDHFVPGGASQAFLKTAWERVGGFPEGMTAGEDTVFGQRLRRSGYEPVIATDAQVEWQAPNSFGEMTLKSYRWGFADGSVATSPRAYARMIAVWDGGIGLAALLAVARLPRLAAASLGAVFTASVWKTRRKHQYLADPVGSILLPVAHATARSTQGFGWLFGLVNSDGGGKAKRLVTRQASEVTNSAKRIIRPYVPERVMKAVRAEVTASSRNNVDILLRDSSEIDAWLDATPATYRVGIESDTEQIEIGMVEIRPTGLDAESQRRLLMAIDGREAAVLAAIRPPRIDRTRINEPRIDPIAVAVRTGLLSDSLPNLPSTLQHLIRQAGLHQAVITAPGMEAQPSRRPITGPGAVVIMGSVPMHDIGGGSRGAQIAHELVARGYHVTYLNQYRSDEATDLGLRYVHPKLDEVFAEDFDLDRYLSRLNVAARIGIVEIPHRGYVGVVAGLRESGFKVAYDLIDDWTDRALGGWGYDKAIEQELSIICDGLMASAPSLVENLEALSTREVSLVPNAVNTRLFTPGDFDSPDDLPAGDGPVIEYHGSLYGDWFDWDALERTATEHPDARVVVIGDERSHPDMPTNVHFLGLKPQHQLPAYLAHTDVAVIPFEVSETTHAVSPLKVFEYLAMGVPVASTPLDPLMGLDGVYTDIDLSAAVSAALAAPKPDGTSAGEAHGWGARMRVVFEMLGLELAADPDARPISITQHAVTHWDEAERRLD